MTANYYLRLDQFEGPLDLLLHLVKVNEIDIFNIDIFLLSSQYIEYLRTVKYDDLSVAGEFVEMAATLIQIKTSLLLPAEENGTGDIEDDEEDPREILQRRLIEYEAFKNAAEYFSEKGEFDTLIKPSMESSRMLARYQDVELPLVGDVPSLVILFEQMLSELSERKPPVKVEAVTHMVTVEAKIEEIAGIIESVNFALFQGFLKKFESRYEMVVYILAILELCKEGRIKIYQQEANGPLWLYKNDFDKQNLPIISSRLELGQEESEIV